MRRSIHTNPNAMGNIKSTNKYKILSYNGTNRHTEQADTHLPMHYEEYKIQMNTKY